MSQFSFAKVFVPGHGLVSAPREVLGLATVFVPGKGLAVAHLRKALVGGVEEVYWLEYTVNDSLWKSHWQPVSLPVRNEYSNYPLQVSLAVDDDGMLIATVLYGSGATASARLTVHPTWHTVKKPYLWE